MEGETGLAGRVTRVDYSDSAPFEAVSSGPNRLMRTDRTSFQRKGDRSRMVGSMNPQKATLLPIRELLKHAGGHVGGEHWHAYRLVHASAPQSSSLPIGSALCFPTDMAEPLVGIDDATARSIGNLVQRPQAKTSSAFLRYIGTSVFESGPQTWTMSVSERRRMISLGVNGCPFFIHPRTRLRLS